MARRVSSWDLVNIVAVETVEVTLVCYLENNSPELWSSPIHRTLNAVLYEKPIVLTSVGIVAGRVLFLAENGQTVDA